jgi:hypothetical protein
MMAPVFHPLWSLLVVATGDPADPIGGIPCDAGNSGRSEATRHQPEGVLLPYAVVPFLRMLAGKAACDFHHKTALALVHQYDVTYYEVIQPANLIRRPAPKPDGNVGYLPNWATRKADSNKSLYDAGWSAFLRMLAGKAACAGKRAEAVSPAYTT